MSKVSVECATPDAQEVDIKHSHIPGKSYDNRLTRVLLQRLQGSILVRNSGASGAGLGTFAHPKEGI